jgi:hypothetical protein
LATLAATTVEQYNDRLVAIVRAKVTDSLAFEVNKKIVDARIVGIADLSESGGQNGLKDPGNSQCNVISGVLTYEGNVYLQADDVLRSGVRSLVHDNPESGYFGAHRTAQVVSRDLYWSAMDATVRKYITGCDVSHRIQPPRHARHGVNMPLLPPDSLWEEVTMDCVTDLPEPMGSGCTWILGVVDRLTKMAIYLPCRKDIDSPELARMCFEHVICKHSLPDNIIPDHSTQFTSPFWTRVYSHMSITH